MKLLFESWRRYLNEVSFSSDKAYYVDGPDEDYEGNVIYTFTDMENPEGASLDDVIKNMYTVTFRAARAPERLEANMIAWEIDFKRSGSPSGKEFSQLTGENRAIRVLSTVIEAIKQFIDSQESSPEGQKRLFMFSGTPVDDEQDSGYTVTKRTRIYKVALQRQLPSGWSVSENKRNQNNILFFNNEELTPLSEKEQVFISTIGGDMDDIVKKIGQQPEPESESEPVDDAPIPSSARET